MSVETIFEDLKNEMSAEYEKETPGFLTYDILKANSIELDKLYTVVEAVNAKLNVANMTGDELTNECYYRRGITRKAAIPSKVVLTITGTGTINAGDLFSTKNDIIFSATETKVISGTGNINAQCTTAGIIGNVGAGSITQIPVTLVGITAVANNNSSYDGFDAETDESLLERYLDDIRNSITSNNIYHFEKWAREISGVGKAKVFPTWNGNNSVKVIIINDNMLPASSELVASVQEYIDPIDVEKWGKGYGQSALGSYCTVVSATPKSCGIGANITKSENYTFEEITAAVTNQITNYFKEIAFSETIDSVSYAKISALILNVDGVLDLLDLRINGMIGNIALTTQEVPVLSSVSIT